MTGTALVNYKERFEADADALAQRESHGGVALSIQGGIFSLAGQTLGTEIVVIIIDSYYEFNFFNPAIPYDAANPLPPVCYAYGRDRDTLEPFPAMQVDLTWFQPQNAECRSCPMNRWQSSGRGKGKACKNRERLFVIPAGRYDKPTRGRSAELHIFEDPSHFAKADAVSLRVPVTSVENWSRYVTMLASAHRRPPYAVFTEVSVRPDPKSQYRLHFEMLELCPDTLNETIVRRVDGQLQQPFPPYSPPTAEQLAAVAAPQQAHSAATWGPRR